MVNEIEMGSNLAQFRDGVELHTSRQETPS
jgi:hypothetical protein